MPHKTFSLVLAIMIASTMTLSAAQVSQPETQQPEIQTPAPVVSPNESEPIVAAQKAKDDVLKWWQEVEKSLHEIQTLSERFDKDGVLKLSVERDAINTYREKIIPTLLSVADELLTQSEDFDRNFLLFQNAVKKAGPKFHDAAEAWNQFALQEDDPEFQELYAIGSRSITRWERLYATRSKQLDNMHRDVTEKILFTKKSVTYLHRMDQVLDLYPSALDEAEELENYIQRLNEFQEQFRSLLKSFQGLSESLEEPKSAPALDHSAANAIRSQHDSKPVHLSPTTSPAVIRHQLRSGIQPRDRDSRRANDFDSTPRVIKVFTQNGKSALTIPLPRRAGLAFRPALGETFRLYRNNQSLGAVHVMDVFSETFAAYTADFTPQVGDLVVMAH